MRLAVCGRGPWNAGFVAERVVRFGDRAVSVVTKDEADKIKAELEEAGASVELK